MRALAILAVGAGCVVEGGTIRHGHFHRAAVAEDARRALACDEVDEAPLDGGRILVEGCGRSVIYTLQRVGLYGYWWRRDAAIRDERPSVGGGAGGDGARCRGPEDCRVGLACAEEASGLHCRPLCGGAGDVGCDGGRRCAVAASGFGACVE